VAGAPSIWAAALGGIIVTAVIAAAIAVSARSAARNGSTSSSHTASDRHHPLGLDQHNCPHVVGRERSQTHKRREVVLIMGLRVPRVGIG
jgi:hypothetical protein